jgi:hypothetical protein
VPAFVLAPLILAAVLAVSGWSKTTAVASTQSVLRLLRLPKVVQQPWVAHALPWGELALAALVVLAPGGLLQQVAAALTLALMLAYWVVVARAMTFDPRPTCGCFGEIGDQRITGRTLARNSVLVALAVTHLLWALAGHSVLATLTDGWDPVVWVLGAAAAALVTWFVTVRPAAEAQGRAEPTGPEPQDLADDDYVPVPVPPALLTDAAGRQHTLGEMARERAQLLIFVNCYCGTTTTALRAWPGYRDRLPQLDVRFVFSGVSPGGLGGDLDVSEVWTDHGGVAARALAIHGSPGAVLLGVDGMVAGGPVSGNDELEAFVVEIAEALSEVPVEAPTA